MTGAVLGWIKIPVKRIKFGFKLIWICRKKGFRFKRCRLFWLCGRNGGRKCNFIVETKKEQLQVKLIGVRSRRVFYGFIDEENFETRDLTFADTRSMGAIDYCAKIKKPYEFQNHSRRLIVMTPISNVVTVQSRAGRREVGNGDLVPEGEFYFARDFLEMLKSID